MKSNNKLHTQRCVLVVLTVVGALAAVASSFAAGAACTAAHANASMSESTPTGAFTDNGDGTVSHNLTGLMWKRCVEGASGVACTSGSPTPMTWSAALTTATADRTAGRRDWRLPNRVELESIIEYCGWGPSINQTMFPATPALTFPGQIFYTSTTYLPGSSRAVGISFLDGFPFILDKAFPFSVRLVRGGRSSDAFDAQPPVVTVTKAGTGSGTVTSNPAGIDCGVGCSHPFAVNTPVTLIATPASGSIFTGWLGACTGTGACNANTSAAINVSATFAPNAVLPKADIDGNNAYGALTDGLLVIRYLFGLAGTSLTAGAIGSLPTRTSSADIAQYSENIKPLLDIDGDGRADASTDGVLLVRYLFGMRGSTLIAGAVSVGATRTTAPQIESYLQSIMP